MAEQAIINTSTLTSIGDAIRTKTGKTDTFLPSSMPEEILAIETGSDVSGVTATASDVRSGKKIVNSSGAVVDGTLTTRSASNVTSSNNVVTIPAGIYDSQVSKTVGTAKSATTYTPGTSNQTISAGYYLTGTQTIKGDANLVASNIKSGVSIFGVSGTYTSPYNFHTISSTNMSLISNGQYLQLALDSGTSIKSILYGALYCMNSSDTSQAFMIMFNGTDLNNSTSRWYYTLPSGGTFESYVGNIQKSASSTLVLDISSMSITSSSFPLAGISNGFLFSKD